MTFTTKTSGRTRRRGFTLIELLVVIGIIVVLVGILVPAYVLARKKAATARTRADLSAIEVALEAYKTDFGGYPPVPGINWLDGSPLPGTGAHVLCQALFGLGPAYPNATGGNIGNDGADGPGFRLRRTIDDGNHTTYTNAYPPVAQPPTPVADDGIPDSFGGTVHPPYLQPETFRFDVSQGFDKVCILDRSNTPNPHAAELGDTTLTGAPILYYPAATTTSNLTTVANGNQAAQKIADTAPYAGGNTTNVSTYSTYLQGSQLPIFNANDNLQDIDSVAPSVVKPQVSLVLLRIMLGDYDRDGLINNGETFYGKQPYLLWARGNDGFWGPKNDSGQAATDADLNANPRLVNRTDDVTNFR